eukprot:TRINITY_DN41736_c0_g3_i1.p1 TRINITY_DN41736_c0_g3~~TRINITY_DN41736_c0_g3_i1.p1  ORF type:complete len:839 (-),score=198.66 TRINITY_DN41736_c0_g3_i1:298-2814(-)
MAPRCLVQFATDIHFISEGRCDRGPTPIRVMRIGDLEEDCSVEWRVEDGPHAGKKYHLAGGTLKFKAGQKLQTVHVQIIGDENFDTMVEFALTLDKPKGCVCGEYLSRTRVKIVDDDSFPSNKFQEDLQNDWTCLTWRDDQDWPMFFEYFKFNYRQNPGSKKKLLADQVDNFIFVIWLYVNKELVNYLASAYTQVKDAQAAKAAGDAATYIALGGEEVHFGPIVFMALVLFLPYAVMYYLDYRANFWGVGGGSRKLLQENLLRKYLVADECTRCTTTKAEVLKCMTLDAPELVKDGYIQALLAIGGFGRFVFLLMFQMYLCGKAQHEKPESAWVMWIAMTPPLVVPIIILIFLRKRNAKTKKGLFSEEEIYKLFLTELTDNIGNFRSVADYYQRPLIVQKVSEEIVHSNKSMVFNAAVKCNNLAALEWMSKIVEVTWVLFGGWQVTQASVDIGTFLATLSIFKANFAQIGKMYNQFLTVQCSFSKMWNVVKYMNFPTDLAHRMQIDATRHGRTEALLDEEKTDFDTMKIMLRDVTYNYPPSAKVPEAPLQSAVQGLELSFDQGSLVAVLGTCHSGRSTLLRLIGGVLLPTEGDVFIPSHLRVLHVDKEVQVFDESIAFNVFFGKLDGRNIKKPKELPKDVLERGWKVCEMLRFPPAMMAKARDLEADEDGFHMTLSSSERKRIHLARAFIYNPEFMIVNTPTNGFDKMTSESILDCLREVVDKRGLADDRHSSDVRTRPRTCIFTTGHQDEAMRADFVLTMGEQAKRGRNSLLGRTDFNLAVANGAVFKDWKGSEAMTLPAVIACQEVELVMPEAIPVELPSKDFLEDPRIIGPAVEI